MNKLHLLLALLFAASVAFAQENHNSMLIIHEDHVIISEEDAYWDVAANMKKMLEENNVKDMNYWAFRMNDGTYMFVSPTQSYAALDKNVWASVAEQVGAEKFQEVASGMAGKYLSHKDYMVNFHPDKSYNMEDMNEADTYREWYFQYVYEDKMDEYNALLKEWHEAFTEADTPMGFGFYTNGFGMEGPVAVFMVWGENAIDVREKNSKTTELMDGKRAELWTRTKKLLYKLETRRGWLMEDLTHMPASE